MKSSCCHKDVICSECGGKHVWAPTLNEEDEERLKFMWIRLNQIAAKDLTLKAREVGAVILEFCDGRFGRFHAALIAQQILRKDELGPMCGPGARYFVREFPR